jgi:chromate transporter
VAIAAAVTCTTRSAQAAGLATSTALLGTATAGGAGTVPLWQLGLFFLKVGAILYGTGYVLVAYLEGGLVERYGWLTRQQLLDAIAIGQFTPGPLLSTATFIGYLVADWPGAVVATAAIFGPSFLFVALTNPLVPRMRKSYAASLVLDAVNAASIGLMLAVTLKLAWALPVPPADMPSLTWNWPSLAIALTATVVSFRWKIAPAWLVLGGATAGGVVRWLA